MPVAKLKRFLDDHEVKYLSITHSKAYTAMDVAQSAHVKGREVAKTVVVKVDDHLAMAVLPATRKVDLDLLRRGTGAVNLDLAKEPEFRGDFPECELGAMPPFGNLYRMDVFVDPRLASNEEIAFNAGSHTEVVRMRYLDYDRLVHPRTLALSAP